MRNLCRTVQGIAPQSRSFSVGMEPSSLLQRNREWASKQEPELFEQMSSGQAPEFLWIGCADSRVPAASLMQLKPGDVFVHRNVANVIVPSDLNSQAVLQYAVHTLKVRHIIVCGHHQCGGVQAAMDDACDHGVIDIWLDHVREARNAVQDRLDALPEKERWQAMCELNALAQARNVARTTAVRSAWRKKQPLAVYAWCYGLNDGLLRDLGCTLESREDIDEVFAKAVDSVFARYAPAPDSASTPTQCQ
ncbi:MAG: hypothetical protein MHM6MM_003347 [Cercozoa sp. M6MM]